MLARITALLSAALVAGCTSERIAGRAMTPDQVPFDRVNANSPIGYEFTNIDVEGAVATIAFGINARGDIVGVYSDGKQVHGFLRQNGVVTTIDYTGSADGTVLGTEARGIGPNGEIVGDYWTDKEQFPSVADHGFRRSPSGEFTRVDFPNHVNTIAQRILPDGTILGCRHDQNTLDTMHGIMIGRADTTELDDGMSMTNGATPDHRRSVGLISMNGLQQAFLVSDGTLTPFMIPSSTATTAWDMNPSGEIVGWYRDTRAVPIHGYVMTDDGYESIDIPDVPNLTATRVFGINAGGDVVGNYSVTVNKVTTTHAFVALAKRAH